MAGTCRKQGAAGPPRDLSARMRKERGLYLRPGGPTPHHPLSDEQVQGKVNAGAKRRPTNCEDWKIQDAIQTQTTFPKLQVQVGKQLYGSNTPMNNPQGVNDGSENVTVCSQEESGSDLQQLQQISKSLEAKNIQLFSIHIQFMDFFFLSKSRNEYHLSLSASHPSRLC